MNIKNFATIFIAFCSSALAQNGQVATPNPQNLNEAAGLYAGASAYLRVVKLSSCGFALSRDAPPLTVVVRQEITPLYPSEHREVVYRELANLEPMMVRQGESLFSSMLNHYTHNERLDHRTSCGYIASSAIGTQKLSKEAMLRMAR